MSELRSDAQTDNYSGISRYILLDYHEFNGLNLIFVVNIFLHQARHVSGAIFIQSCVSSGWLRYESICQNDLSLFYCS